MAECPFQSDRPTFQIYKTLCFNRWDDRDRRQPSTAYLLNPPGSVRAETDISDLPSRHCQEQFGVIRTYQRLQKLVSFDSIT